MDLNNHKFILLASYTANALGQIRSLGEKGIKPIAVLVHKNTFRIDKSKYISKLYNVENINERTKVYFKFSNNNYVVENIKLNVHSESRGYRVYYKKYTREGQTQSNSQAYQDVLRAYYEEGKPGDKLVEIKAVYPTGKLRIIKVDKQYNEVLLNGAQFKIYSKTGWVVKQ